jgi:plasmid stabilization system protein ParE
MRVELRDEARDDLVSSAGFYGRQSPGLDDYFIERLHEDLRNLQTTFGVHERYRGFYRKLSRRFPFAIYYLLTDDIVDVVAILDSRSDPHSTDARLGRTKP